VTAVLAVVTVGLVATAVVRSWQSSHRQRADAALERTGIAYVRPEIRLVAVLAAGEITVARGTAVDMGPVRAAMAAVDGAPGAGTLGTGARWADLRGRVDALTTGQDTGASAAQAWADAVVLAGQLLDAAITAAGLDRDPDLASHNLIDAAVNGLPSVIVYAGRSGDIAAQAAGGTPTAAQELALAVDTYQVALLATRLDAQLTTGADAASDITTQVDAFESAVSTFVPPSAVTREPGTVQVVGLADSALTVQATALALATDLLARVDGVVAERESGLRDDQTVAVAVGIGVLLSAAALAWLLVPVRPRRGGPHDADEAGPGRVPEPAAPADDLIDARDLPLDTLVHAGRGARSPATRGHRRNAQ